jgi:hypothetical protein
MKKEKVGEYDEFASQDFGFQEEQNPQGKEEEEKEERIEQELYNMKAERIVGIEADKQQFDTKYKESLVKYINNNSFKNKSNTGTVIGESSCKTLV